MYVCYREKFTFRQEAQMVVLRNVSYLAAFGTEYFTDFHVSLKLFVFIQALHSVLI